MKIAIACGGTGGHLFPGIALAEELSRRGHIPILIISEKNVDQEASAKYDQFEFITQPSRPKPSLTSVQMIPFVSSLFKTTQQSKQLYRTRGVDAVIGMGGFTCFGPLFAAKSLKIPSFIHDSNAVPGKTNRFLARYVDQVLLGLEPAKAYFSGHSCKVVGTPLRDEMKVLPTRKEAAKYFGLKADKPTVFIFGGSQGAQKLNSIVLEAAKHTKNIQFLHVTGSSDYKRIESERTSDESYHTIPFCDNMPAAYAVSDFVICRSGASSLTELSYLALPSLLVPFPFAADDHQTKNAEAYTDHDAAFLKQEKDLTGLSLAEFLEKIMADGEQLKTMGDKIQSLAKDPAAQICDLLERS